MMMKRFLYIAALLAAGLSLTGCIEEYNAELPTSASNLLVVEGTILSDSVSTFYLSRTMPVNADYYDTEARGATITLVGTDGLNVAGTLAGTGTYRIKTPALNANEDYKVVVTYDGDTYESEPQKPFPSLPIQAVEFNQPNPNAAINVLVTTNEPANPSEIQYFRWTYDETWEVHPEMYCTVMWDPEQHTGVDVPNLYPRRGWISSSSKAIIASSSAYYSNNQIKQFKLYDVARDNRRLYVLYSTKVNQRSLRKAEYEYEMERAKISSDMGGLFTPQPSALPTNLHCTTSSKRVLGYVGCSLNVAQYRVFANSDDFTLRVKSVCDEVTSFDDDFPGNEEMFSRGYVLSHWLLDPMQGLDCGWTSRSCVDVRAMGATADMPPYWPVVKEY